jgi:hypothetical protein
VDTRHANAYLFGAFCPARDTGVALVLPTANTEMMQLHVNEISEQLPGDVHAAMLIDGAGWHIADDLKVPENMTFIKLPAAAPELNPAEKPWQYLKDNFLSGRVFESYEEIVEATCKVWNQMISEKGRIKSLTSYQSVYQII